MRDRPRQHWTAGQRLKRPLLDSNATGDWFNRTCLCDRSHIQGHGHHCFRHSFITAVEWTGVPEARIERITGHGQGVSALPDHYIDVPTLAERASTRSARRMSAAADLGSGTLAAPGPHKTTALICKIHGKV
jgi:hypothetical protein